LNLRTHLYKQNLYTKNLYTKNYPLQRNVGASQEPLHQEYPPKSGKGRSRTAIKRESFVIVAYKKWRNSPNEVNNLKPS
jgi:hypothetical protein